MVRLIFGTVKQCYIRQLCREIVIVLALALLVLSTWTADLSPAVPVIVDKLVHRVVEADSGYLSCGGQHNITREAIKTRSMVWPGRRAYRYRTKVDSLRGSKI